MEREFKIWLITLAVLLAAALTSTVLFKIELDKKSTEVVYLTERQAQHNLQLEDVQAQLADAQAQLGDSGAQLADAQTQLDDSKAQLATAQQDAADAEAELTEAQNQIESISAQLVTANDERDALKAQLEDVTLQLEALQAEGSAGELEALESMLVEKEEKIAELETKLDEAQRLVTAAEEELARQTEYGAELETQIETAQDEIARLTQALYAYEGEQPATSVEGEEVAPEAAELSAARLELDAANAHIAELEENIAALQQELDFYMQTYGATQGESHLSALVDGGVRVAADHVTADYALSNNTDSGNSIMFELILDGRTLYASQPIAPGEALGEFTLNEALEPGAYEATAQITTLVEGGNASSVTRIPVIVSVAE